MKVAVDAHLGRFTVGPSFECDLKSWSTASNSSSRCRLFRRLRPRPPFQIPLWSEPPLHGVALHHDSFQSGDEWVLHLLDGLD